MDNGSWVEELTFLFIHVCNGAINHKLGHFDDLNFFEMFWIGKECGFDKEQINHVFFFSFLFQHGEER